MNALYRIAYAVADKLGLGRVVDKLRGEPVRVRLYAVGVAVLALAQSLGYVDASQVEQWAGALAYVLVVENARKNVKPMKKVREGDGYVDPLR